MKIVNQLAVLIAVLNFSSVTTTLSYSQDGLTHVNRNRPLPPPHRVQPPVMRPPAPRPPRVRPQPPRPLPPPPRPQPPRPLPPPSHGGDLYGYCNDWREYDAAKDFAYRSSGLNYTASGAEIFARNYVDRHACGTIHEFINRYSELYNYAYSTSYLNRTSTAARNYALDLAEYTPTYITQKWKRIFKEIHQFAYSTSYLNYTSARAIDISKQWNDRGYCGDEYVISRLKNDYRYYFDYAYSSRGLNYTAPQARIYALERMQGNSSCMDLMWP